MLSLVIRLFNRVSFWVVSIVIIVITVVVVSVSVVLAKDEVISIVSAEAMLLRCC